MTGWLSRLIASKVPSGGDATVDLYIDGPNVFRPEFDIDLDEIRSFASTYGRLGLRRLFLDEHATPGLIQAGEARGFEVRITSGDVDVALSIDATDRIAHGEANVLVLVSRDTDFKPLLEYASKAGLRTIAIAPGDRGRSDALSMAADEAFVIDDRSHHIEPIP